MLFSRVYHRFSDEILTVLFFSGFIVSLVNFVAESPTSTDIENNYINDSGMVVVWLLVMLACVLLGGYYFLNSLSKFMDRYEPSSILTDDNRIKFYVTVYFSILVIIVYLAIEQNIPGTKDFFKGLQGGLYILQMILFLMALGELFTYLSRPKTGTLRAYAGEPALEFQKKTSQRFISDSLNRFLTKNLIIIVNFVNLVLLVTISFF